MLYPKRVKRELWGWAAEICKVEAAHDHTCVMQAAAEVGAFSLLQALDANMVELDKLHSSGGTIPHGITGANRMHGSHHYG